MPHIEIKMYPGRSEEIKKRYCRKDKRLSCKRNEYGNKILFRISKRNRERTVAGRSGGKNTKRRNVCRGQLLIGDGGFLEIVPIGFYPRNVDKPCGKDVDRVWITRGKKKR